MSDENPSDTYGNHAEAETDGRGIVAGNGVTNESPVEPAQPPAEGSLDDLSGGARSLAYHPQLGDKCVIDGQLATLVAYDEAANVYTAERLVGNSMDRVTGHITGTRFEGLQDGNHVISSDNLDYARDNSSMVAGAQQESVDAGLARVTASQGNQFTSLTQQRYLVTQPQNTDSQERAVEKMQSDLTQTDYSTGADAAGTADDGADPGSEGK